MSVDQERKSYPATVDNPVIGRLPQHEGARDSGLVLVVEQNYLEGDPKKVARVDIPLRFKKSPAAYGDSVILGLVEHEGHVVLPKREIIDDALFEPGVLCRVYMNKERENIAMYKHEDSSSAALVNGERITTPGWRDEDLKLEVGTQVHFGGILNYQDCFERVEYSERVGPDGEFYSEDLKPDAQPKYAFTLHVEKSEVD